MAEIDEFRKRRFDAISELIASRCDPRDLPLVAVSHADGDHPQTLDEALRHADVVVTARVIKTEFRLNRDVGMPTAHSTLAIDVVLKGNDASEISLYQAGGPMPDNGGIIGHFAGAPILLSGDHVLLIARKRTNGDGYRSSYPVGTYYIRGGVIRVPDSNPCDWLDGRPLSEAVALLRAAISDASDEAAQPCDWSRF